MFDTVEKVITWLSKVEGDLQPLHDRMRDDLAMYRVEDTFPDDSPQPKKKHRTMARNDMRTLADKVSGILQAAKLEVTLPTVYGQEEKVEAYSNLERMAMVGLEEVDERLRSRLQGDLKTVGATDVTARGWLCGFWQILDQKDGIGFDMKRWEPMETYFSLGERGIYRAAHRRWEPEGQLALEYTELDLDEAKDTSLEVIDFWEVVKTKTGQQLYNSIVVNKQWGKKPTLQKFTSIPVAIIPVPGPIPAVDSSGERLNVEEWGESVFGAGRKIAALYNELDTEMLEKALSEMHRGRIHSGPGAREIAESIEKGGEDDLEHSTPEMVKSETVPSGPIPNEAMALRMSLQQQLDKAGLSSVSWGQVYGDLSGLAIANLAAQEESFITPRANAMAAFIKFGIEAWLHQLSALNKPFSGMFKQKGKGLLSIKVEQWEKVPRIEVEIRPQLPGKNLQAVAAALQLRMPGAGGQPLLSDLTILEQYLGIEDPVGEERRKAVQRAKSLPFVELQELANSARRTPGLEEFAELLEQMADRALRQAYESLGPSQPNVPPGGGPPPGMPPPGSVSPGMPPPGMQVGPGDERGAPLPGPEAMSPGAFPTLPQPGMEPGGVGLQGLNPIEEIRRMLTAPE